MYIKATLLQRKASFIKSQNPSMAGGDTITIHPILSFIHRMFSNQKIATCFNLFISQIFFREGFAVLKKRYATYSE